MTGGYEEPETRREIGPVSAGDSVPSGKQAAEDAVNGNGTGDEAQGTYAHSTPDYGAGPPDPSQEQPAPSQASWPRSPQQPLAPGNPPEGQGQQGQANQGQGNQGQYAEPETSPGKPYPNIEHPPPSYVDHTAPYYATGTPNTGAVPPAPPYGDPSASGPRPVQYGQNQQGNAPYNDAPHYAEGTPPVPPTGSGAPSGPQVVAGNLSGPQPPPQQGGFSGPNPIPGDPSARSPQDVGQAFQQQQQQQQQPQQQQPFPQPPPSSTDQPFGPDLSSAQLLRQTKRAPQSGWRRAVYLASGRSINLGESAEDQRRRELISRINQPLQGCYKIAMLSLKGGVGKTTATATLGSTFSSLRGDRVVAVDANPDRGTLSQKIPLETTATVRHLLRDAQRVRRYSDVRSYTSQGPSRLEILASERDPAVSEAFSEDDYRRTITMLEHFYNVVLTDCGTGLMHSAMKGVLDVADSLVIVSSSSIDGARSASATLDWLDAHGYGQLVARSVAVINSVRPGSGKVDVDKLAEHFDSRCRAVAKIPFDQHLEEGAEVELDQLAGPTRLALLELAAIVADDFPQAPDRQR